MNLTWIEQGGIIMIVLIAAYFISVGITLERFFYFFWAHISPAKFMNALDKAIETDTPLEDFVKTLPKRKQSPYAILCETFLANKDLDKEKRDDLMFAQSSRLLTQLSSSIWVLHLIGTISPMIGLMGTMTGLIKSFKGIESLAGHVDISVLAGGIWEAMLTTVAGLVVGILSLFAYRILDHYVDKRAQYFEELVALLNGTHP